MSHLKTALIDRRTAAQDVHRQVSSTITKEQALIEAELKAVTENAHKVAQIIKAETASQTEAVKMHLHAAVAKLDAAGANVETSIATGRDHIHNDHSALQGGAHATAPSVSHADAIVCGFTAAQSPLAPRATA